MIYLDNASTTQVLPAVEAAMRPFLGRCFGNAGSLHASGREAAAALESSRAGIARAIGAKPLEIVFTSGATEANNWALGLARRHIILSSIEHDSLAAPARSLAARGVRVTVLPVDARGRVDSAALDTAIRGDTGLVSIIVGNHEIGTVQAVAALARVCRRRRVLFHTDAAQAFTKMQLDVRRLGIGLMTLSAHKIHGPKGVGALYVRGGVPLEPLLLGGGQEGGRRSGTENVAGIVGFATAVELARQDRAGCARMARLRRRLARRLLVVPQARVHGMSAGLPHILSVGFAGVQGEEVLQHLSLQGIYVSTGSTCRRGAPAESPVLRAIGVPKEYAQGTVRFSLSRLTTALEVDRAAAATGRIVTALRLPFNQGPSWP